LPEKQEFEKVEDCQSRALTLCYESVEFAGSACGWWCWYCCGTGIKRWAVRMRLLLIIKGRRRLAPYLTSTHCIQHDEPVVVQRSNKRDQSAA
jgi:hypothetical protein